MPDGIIIIDKPKGPTSFEVVKWVRKLTSIKRVGHAGTLDPMASGVLTVCVGEATKLVPYFMDSEKEYEATIYLGITTDTDDAAPEAKVLSRAPVEKVTALPFEKIRTELQSFVGWYEQRPPAFSALKVDGKRLYEEARSARTEEEKEALSQHVLLKQRRVWIQSIKIMELSLPEIKVHITCGKGTYIRSVARDLGEKLRVGAHLKELRRTRVGPFTTDQAIPYQCKIPPSEGHLTLLPLARAVSHLPKIVVPLAAVKKIQNGSKTGVKLMREQFQKMFESAEKNEQPIALFNEKDDLLAILVYEENSWKIGRGFYRSY